MWSNASGVFVFVLSLSVSPIFGALPLKAQVRYSKPGDFIIGGLFSIHFSINGACDYGPLSRGVQQSQLMIFAIEQINNRTDLLPNVTLGFDLRDYCGDESIVASVALSLAGVIGTDDGTSEPKEQGQFIGIVGAGGSATSIVTALVTSIYEIPTIGYRGSTIELSDKERFPYFLRTLPSGNLQAGAIVDILLRFNWLYVGLIYSLDSYGIHGAQEVKNLAEKSGICLAYAIPIRESATENEVQEIIDKILRFKKASVVVFFCTSTGAKVILPALTTTAPGHPGITLVLSDSFGNARDFLKWGVANVTTGSVKLRSYYKEVPGFNAFFRDVQKNDSPLSPWFQELIQKCRQDNACPVLTTSSGARQHVMDAVYAFATALDEILQEDCAGNVECLLNGTVTGNAVLSHLRDIKFVGVDGAFEFDGNGDPVGKYSVQSMQYVDGAYSEEYIGYWDSRDVKENRLDIQIGSLKWAYGAVTPPRSTCRDECRLGYKVVPLEDKCCYGCQRCQENAIVVNNTKCVECDMFYWPTENFTICEMIIPSPVDLQNGVIIIILTLSSIGVIISALAASGLFYYRQHALIKATGRELSCVNIVGLFVTFLSVYLILTYPTSVSCSLSDTMIALSLTLTYAPTFLKVNRIHRIFTAGKKSNKRPKFIGPRDQLIIVSTLTSFQVSLFIFLKVADLD